MPISPGTSSAGVPIDAVPLVINFVYGEATPLDCAFFVADRAYVVKSVVCRPLVVGSDGGSVTTILTKAPSGTAAASGTALTGAADLKGTINTNQTLALSATAAALALAAGDAICLDTTGTMTAARGVITVVLMPA